MPIYSIRISNINTASKEFLTKSSLNNDAASRLAQELAIDLERQDSGAQYTITISDVANRPVAKSIQETELER